MDDSDWLRLSDNGGIEDEDDISGDHNCAFFTFDMLESTPTGVTFPVTVTFFAANSMLKDVTPATQHQWVNSISIIFSCLIQLKNKKRIIKLNIILNTHWPSILERCFLNFLSHPLQCNDTFRTTTFKQTNLFSFTL